MAIDFAGAAISPEFKNAQLDDFSYEMGLNGRIG